MSAMSEAETGEGGAVLTRAEQATPSWLTGVLRRSGVLPEGRVEAVDVAPRSSSQATLVRLTPRYAALEGAAPPAAPRALLLKLAPARPGPAALPSADVAFFRHVAPRTPDLPTPRVFDAAQDVAEGPWHLLMEDVSDTHTQPPYPVPPTEPHCFAAVGVLAALHAAWWERPELPAVAAAAGVRVPTEADLARLVERTERTVTAFVAFLGDRLPPARRTIFARLLAGQVALRRRQLARPRTVVHGDAHWWNFLYPRPEAGEGPAGGPESGARAAGAARVLLIDWAFWETGPALGDLAGKIAGDWFPERRRRLERPLLEHYHRELGRHGVTGYPWRACWEDYRLFAATRPLTLAFRWQRGERPLVWWNNLERALLAFDDLGCAELLDA
jgi:hypothetical protein